MIDFTEYDHTGESGLRIPGDGRMEDIDAWGCSVSVALAGRGLFIEHTHASLAICLGRHIMEGFLDQHCERSRPCTLVLRIN